MQGGYVTTDQAWKAIIANNPPPTITDPQNIPDGTIIVIPLAH